MKFSLNIFKLYRLDKGFPRHKPLKKIGIAEEIRNIYEAHEKEIKRKRNETFNSNII